MVLMSIIYSYSKCIQKPVIIQLKMGYEQVVPPIPDRKAELEGINRLEQSWFNQPYYKYYMNESLREPKMAYANRINKVYSQFFFNTAVAAVALIPLTLLCRRLFVRQGRFPVTFTPDYFNKIRTDNEIRRWKYIKWVLPFHLLGASIVAYYFTDYEHVFDWNYEFVHKSKKIM